MSKGYFKITIATKPYLQKYLQRLYGNPLTFSNDREFGMTVAAYLQVPVLMNVPVLLTTPDGKEPPKHLPRPMEIHKQKAELTMRLERFDSFLDIQIPKRFFTRYKGGLDIEDSHVIVLNQLFDIKFTEELWKKATMLNLIGVEFTKAYKAVCDQYGIVIGYKSGGDDGYDITMDALKKKETRFRKKIEKDLPHLSLEGTRNNLQQIVLANFSQS